MQLDLFTPRPPEGPAAWRLSWDDVPGTVGACRSFPSGRAPVILVGPGRVIRFGRNCSGWLAAAEVERGARPAVPAPIARGPVSVRPASFRGQGAHEDGAPHHLRHYYENKARWAMQQRRAAGAGY